MPIYQILSDPYRVAARESSSSIISRTFNRSAGTLATLFRRRFSAKGPIVHMRSRTDDADLGLWQVESHSCKCLKGVGTE